MRRLGTALFVVFVLLAPLSGRAVTESSHAGEETHQQPAAHGDAHGGDSLSCARVLSSPDLWGSIVNFLVLAGLLFYAVRKKVNPTMAEKRAEMEAALKEAQQLKQEAEAKYAEYQSRLNRLDHELANIRADMVKAGEAERDRMVSDAEQTAARIRKDTRFFIEQQMKQLRKDLREESIEAAIASAEKLLDQSAAASDQERLANAYLARLVEAAEERQRRS